MKKSARKRLLAIFLTVCMALSLLPTAFAAAEEPFVDVPQEAWYFNDVEYVTQRGYFSGTGSGEFSPEVPMTRAMFVTVLARLDGAALDGAAAFDDVPAGTWYAGAVAWAVENDIASGVGGGLFAPEKPVTREQMAAIMARYIEYYAKKQNVTFEAQSAGVGFTDAADISAFAAEAVGLCRGYGLISGLGDGRFAPKDDSTRAQVASVVHRLAQFLTTGTPVKDKPTGAISGGSSASATVKTAADFMAAANASADYVTATLQPDSFITVNDDIAITNDSVSVLTLDLGNANAGNLTINSTSARTINIKGAKGSANEVLASISSLTINAPYASVTNEVNVGGSVNIQAVSQNTFNNTGAITGNIIFTGKGAVNDMRVWPAHVVIATNEAVAVKGNSTNISVTAENANVTVNTAGNTKPTVSSTASGVTLTVATDMQVTLTGTMETVTATAAKPDLVVDGTVAVVKAESANTLTLSGSGTIENVQAEKNSAAITVTGESGGATTSKLTVSKLEAPANATVTAPDNVIGTVAAKGDVTLAASVQTVEAAANASVTMESGKTAATVEAKGNVTITGSGMVGQIDALTGIVTVSGEASVTAVNNTGSGEVTLSGDKTQNITVTKKAPKPAGITVTPSETANTCDTITGLNAATMEYRAVGGAWTSDNISDGKVTPQTPGAYEIRTKATGDAQASEPVTVTVAKAVGVSSASIQGEPYVGQTLTAAANVDATGTLSYQWFAGNDAILNATGKTFTPTDDQVGKTIKVTITNYTNTTQTSTETDAVTVDKTALKKLNAKAAEVQVGVAVKTDGTTADAVALGVVFVTEAEAKAIQAAVTAACSVIENNAGAKTSEVNEQVKALTAAINDYVNAKKVGTHDDVTELKAALGTLINNADAAKTGVITDKGKAEDVEPGSKWVRATDNATFTNAISAADTIQKNTNATAAQLSDAITTLNAALTAYQKVIREGAALDHAALTAAIAAAELNAASVVTSTNGTDVLPGQNWVTQTQKDAYTQAITAAKNVKVGVQQDNINALAALETATNTFNKAKQPGTKDIIAPIVTNVTVTPPTEGKTYTIKFTSNEAGSYAYQLGATSGQWTTDATVTESTETTFEYTLETVSNGILYIQVKDAGGNATIVSVAIGEAPTDAVASVGGAKYETLVEAVAAAPSGATVTLLKDASGAGIGTFDGATGDAIPVKDFTIDFGGHAYTCTGPAVGSSGTQNQAFHLEKGANVTLKNGVIKAGTDAPIKMIVQNYCNLTLEDITLDGANLNETACYTLSNNFGNVVIKGNTNIYAKEGQVAFDVWYGMHSTYLDGVSVTFDDTFTGEVSGTIEYGADTAGSAVDNWRSKAALTIGGNGKFTGSFAEGSTGALTGANITITGGTFSVDPSDYVAASHKAVKESDEKWTIAPRTETDEDNVASVGTTYYSDLQAAFDAAEDNQTVTVLQDVVVDEGSNAVRYSGGKNITVDFGSHSLTSNTTNAAIVVVDNETAASVVTLKNGTITAGANAYCTVIAGSNNDKATTVTLEGMTLNNSRQYGNSIKAFEGATINVTDTTVNSTNGAGGTEAAGGTINITNCTYDQGGYYDHNSTNTAVSNGGVLNIYSGSFTSANYGAYVFNSGGTINIYGGAFDASEAVLKADKSVKSAPSVINVFGGSFTGAHAIQAEATLSITGGTFSVDPQSYVADGYAATSDGTSWTVTAQA